MVSLNNLRDVLELFGKMFSNQSNRTSQMSYLIKEEKNYNKEKKKRNKGDQMICRCVHPTFLAKEGRR